MIPDELPKHPHNLLAGLSLLLGHYAEYVAICEQCVEGLNRKESIAHLQVEANRKAYRLVYECSRLSGMEYDARQCFKYLYGYVPSSLLPEFTPTVSHPCH